MTNTQFDDILEQIETIKREVQGKSRRKVDYIKKDWRQIFDKMTYETYYDKRFKLANYNKLALDIEGFEKTKFYMLFIRIPNIQKEYFNDDKYIKNAFKFINEIKKIVIEGNGFMRKTMYIICDYIVVLVDKEYIEPVYKDIKALKDSTEYAKDYQMFFKKFLHTSSKVGKNIKSVIKEANKVFQVNNNQ